MAYGVDTDSETSEVLTVGARSGAHSLLLHNRLLGRRLYIQAIVRFCVAAGIVVGALGAKHVAGIEGLDVPSLLILAFLLALFNVGAFAATRRYQDLERAAASYRFLQGLMHLTISVDFLFLTVGLWLVGGAKSPFQSFYLVHVILAAILLSPRSAFLHALFGYALLTGLVLGEWWGVIPIRFPVGAVNSATPLDGRYVVTVLVVQGFLMIMTLFLVTGLAHLLRQGERNLRVANVELRRLSNIHRDFFHIAVHDLKSPVSAAIMLLDGFRTATRDQLTEEQQGWLARVHRRLEEVTSFLRDFEVMASVELADFERHSEEIDLAELLHRVVNANRDIAQARNHSIHVDVDGNLPRIRGVKRLIQEAVANLVTNAIKYTPDNGTIVVRGRRNGTTVRVEVQDSGIGIAPEDQRRLFQEFVRVRRVDTPAEGITGSGLGLSIVRKAVEAHGGSVGVASRLNEGSTFHFELPLDQIP